MEPLHRAMWLLYNRISNQNKEAKVDENRKTLSLSDVEKDEPVGVVFIDDTRRTGKFCRWDGDHFWLECRRDFRKYPTNQIVHIVSFKRMVRFLP
jgi:hypothetical protein